MAQKVTIKEVAEIAGVAQSTVSRYLNNGYISAEKQARVRAAIEKTGFHSNFFAKRLKTKDSKLIGIVLPRIDSVTVGKLLAGVSRILEPNGYQGLLLISHLDSQKELNNIRNLLQQGVDGIIVDSVAISREHIKLSKAANIPILFTGQKDEAVPCVKIDDYKAGRMMGAYLRMQGHKKAVFAGVTTSDIAVGVDRRQGFIDAFTEKRNAVVDFIETGFDFFSAYNLAPQILEKKASVIVGATDNISLGILRYLHERRIKVPDTVSVAGFGGYDVGSVVYPSLTTISFDYELMGMKTANYLLDLLKGKEITENLNMPLYFVARESVKKLN